MRPITPKMQQVLTLVLANPGWGRVKVSRSLGIRSELASYRLKALRRRGLIPYPPPRNSQGKSKGRTQVFEYLFLRAVRNLQWRTDLWVRRLQKNRRFPEIREDLEESLARLDKIEKFMTKVVSEIEKTQPRRGAGQVSPT